MVYYWFIYNLIINKLGLSETSQQVMVSAAHFGDLSLITGTYTAEREKQFLQVVLLPLHIYHNMCLYAHTWTHTYKYIILQLKWDKTI